MTVCALVPIKNPAKAKTRLRAVLSANETSLLAKHMAIETIDVLTHCPSVGRVVLLGNSQMVTEIAGQFGCEVASEDPSSGLSANLLRTGNNLGLAATDTLAIFPADIPLIVQTDVESLLKRHEHGLTLCPAACDGGTNALLITPPGAIEFHYGIDSARLHAEAARAAGLPVRVVDSPAFSRDIDTVEDLEWLCRYLRGGRLFEALHTSGIATRVSESGTALSA